MTTNHRPTLESKRGHGNPIKDTIQHARALGGQKELKLRPDIEGAKVSPSLGKRALEETESSRKRRKDEEDEEESQATLNTDASSLESGSLSDDEREDGENKESREVIAELKKAKDEEQRAGHDNLLKTKGGRSSWRNTPFRGKKETNDSNNKQLSYTTDTLHSETHRKFLSKYIR